MHSVRCFQRPMLSIFGRKVSACHLEVLPIYKLLEMIADEFLVRFGAHDSTQEYCPMVFGKLLEANRGSAEQTGNGVRDSRCRATRKIAKKLGHDSDTPVGHSRLAHPVCSGGERERVSG